MLSIAIYCLSLFFISLLFFRPRRSDVFFILFISIYHYCFSYLFLAFTKNQITDSSNYFKWAEIRSYDELSYTSTDLIIYLVKLIRELGLSYEDIFLTFSMVSGLSIIGMFVYLTKNSKTLTQGLLNRYTLFLLPGLHFWTVAIGKDALCLLAFYFICSSNFKRNSIKLILGLLLLLLVRYHILVFIIIGLVSHIFLTSNLKPFNISKGIVRLIASFLTVPLGVLVYRYTLSSIQKYSSTGFDGLTSFIDNRANVYADVGSGVLLANQPYVVKVFALVYGGIPWLSLDILSLFSMAEGSIISVLLYFSIKNFFLIRKINNPELEKPKLLFWFICVFILLMPLISSNLGLMVRMRVMLYLPLIYLYFQFKEQNKLEKKYKY